MHDINTINQCMVARSDKPRYEYIIGDSESSLGNLCTVVQLLWLT